jgi:hypothetical protein
MNIHSNRSWRASRSLGAWAFKGTDDAKRRRSCSDACSKAFKLSSFLMMATNAWTAIAIQRLLVTAL